MKGYHLVKEIENTSTSFKHSHKKWKDSLETRAVLLIFYLELEISGLAVQRIDQSSKKWWLLWGIALWKWLSDYFSYILLLWLWCQCFWGSSEDCYLSKKVSVMLFVCCSLLNSQNISINNSEKRWFTYLLGHLQHIAKRVAEVVQKKEQ